jgi:hypothetical protein
VLANGELYCTIRDAEHWRSELLTGAEIKQLIQEIEVFKSQDDVPDNYAPVKLGNCLIAVWCDPTKPELAWVKERKAPVMKLEVPVAEKALPEDALNLSGIVLAAASSSVRAALAPTAVNSVKD